MQLERTTYDHNEVERRAFRAYFRRFGKDAPTPSGSAEWTEYFAKTVIVLSNVNGPLAWYRVKEDGSLSYDGRPLWREIEEIWNRPVQHQKEEVAL